MNQLQRRKCAKRTSSQYLGPARIAVSLLDDCTNTYRLQTIFLYPIYCSVLLTSARSIGPSGKMVAIALFNISCDCLSRVSSTLNLSNDVKAPCNFIPLS